MINLCYTCSIEFEAKTNRARYCCAKCKSESGATRHQLICLNCSEAFYNRVKTQKYCSKSCALSHSTQFICKKFTCIDCSDDFEFKGRSFAKRCSKCRKLWSRIRTSKCATKQGRIKCPGIGSGGNQFGENNHEWKGGIHRKYKGNYKSRCLKYYNKQCVSCHSVETIEVHHIDADTDNCSPLNLVPLCKLCHASIHSKRKLTKEELLARLISIWPECQSKIAELSEKIFMEDNSNRSCDPTIVTGAEHRD